ncbi:MAG TPA: Spy/CpxP family protein refolding chaperone [Nitrospira sp.]|nr:Spy/CpxP family protein refolding chaperone [Nitrospira sp.]
MTSITKTTAAFVVASACLLVVGLPSLWANDPSYGHAGGGHGYGKGMMHSGTGHLIRHLLKHEKEIGLTADQVTKLKDIQLNLDKARIKAEADIQIAERELNALTDNEQSDLTAIETKLRQSEDLQVGLRMTSIKTRRDVMGLLTPEQRAKEKSEHDKAMQQHKGYGAPHGGATPYGMNPHSANPHGVNPHGKNPHEAVSPTPPSNMSVQ